MLLAKPGKLEVACVLLNYLDDPVVIFWVVEHQAERTFTYYGRTILNKVVYVFSVGLGG